MKFYGMTPRDFFDISVDQFFLLIDNMEYANKVVGGLPNHFAHDDWVKQRMLSEAERISREQGRVY